MLRGWGRRKRGLASSGAWAGNSQQWPSSRELLGESAKVTGPTLVLFRSPILCSGLVSETSSSVVFEKMAAAEPAEGVRRQWGEEGVSVVALLQERQLQTATYAIPREEQGTKVIFSRASVGLSAVAQAGQGLDSPKGEGNPPVMITPQDSATSTTAKKVPAVSTQGGVVEGGVVQEAVGEDEGKVESSESWVVVGGQEGVHDVAAGSEEQEEGGAKDQSQESPSVRQVWGEGPQEQGGDREEKAGAVENAGDMEVEDIEEAVLLASEDATASPGTSPVAVLSLSKEITAEEPQVTPAEVEQSPGKAEPEVIPNKEELRVTPPREEPRVTPPKEEPRVTPPKEEPRVTPAKTEPQVTPLKLEAEATMSQEVTSAEMLAEAAGGATPAEEPREMFSTPEGGQLLPQVRVGRQGGA